MSLFSTINHGIAQLEAHERILKFRVAPILGAAIGASALAYDMYQTHDPKKRKKVVIRDGLVILGVSAASVLALMGRWAARKNGAGRIFLGLSRDQVWKKAKQATGETQGLKTLFGELADSIDKALTKKPKAGANQVTEPHYHGGIYGTNPESRVKGLYRASVHHHGTSAALEMSWFAAMAIFLGGVGFGTVADAINGEDWRTTWKHKTKEGLFQFLGNITMCTVAIWAISLTARGISSGLWKSPGFQKGMVESTRAHLGKIKALKPEDLRLVPSGFSQLMETAWVKSQGKPEGLTKILEQEIVGKLFQTDVKANPLFGEALKSTIQGAVKTHGADKAALKATLWQHLAQTMKQDIDHVIKTPDALASVAEARLHCRADTIGVILGFFSGVFGGALVSNGVNHLLTRYLGFPEGHTVNGLFKGHQHHKPDEVKAKSYSTHGHGTSSKQDTPEAAKDDGWLAGKIGPRGIHWFDWILHADDIPGFMYMAGVEMMESLIQLFYGISGLVTGTVGTDYRDSAPEKSVIPSPVSKRLPLSGSALVQKPRGFRVFETV